MSTPRTHLRWMILRDHLAVLAIENLSFAEPWSEQDLRRCLRGKDTIGMVAERGDSIAGFMVYNLLPKEVHVLNFAVHPEYRRDGVGRAMLDKLKDKLASHRRTSIVLQVRETNLPAQLFFKAMGFKAEAVLRDWYEGGKVEDAYQFCFRLDVRAAEADELLATLDVDEQLPF